MKEHDDEGLVQRRNRLGQLDRHHLADARVWALLNFAGVAIYCSAKRDHRGAGSEQADTDLVLDVRLARRRD